MRKMKRRYKKRLGRCAVETLGHQVCLAQHQRNLYFGRMMSPKVNNQTDALCLPFKNKGASPVAEKNSTITHLDQQLLPLGLYRLLGALSSKWSDMHNLGHIY